MVLSNMESKEKNCDRWRLLISAAVSLVGGGWGKGGDEAGEDVPEDTLDVDKVLGSGAGVCD